MNHKHFYCLKWQPSSCNQYKTGCEVRFVNKLISPTVFMLLIAINRADLVCAIVIIVHKYILCKSYLYPTL